jgi:hypothetical protein
MKNLRIVTVVLGGLFCSSLAHAQATRTWVSGVGDDVNPCSRTAPCKTFAGAISKTAAFGEINVLDPGGFGAVTVTKSITISSEGFEAGVLVSGTNGIIVNLPTATDMVVLRGLDIEGLGNGLAGITFIGAGKLSVEKCTIEGFRGSPGLGIKFTPNAASAQLHVVDTIIRNNGSGNVGGGILVQPTPAILVAASIATGDLTRVVLENNVFGLKVTDGANISVRDTVSGGNGFAGFTSIVTTAGAPAKLTIADSSSTNNGTIGVQANGVGAETRISNVTTTGNGTGLAFVSGGALISFKNNNNDGNGTNGAPSSTVTPQ